MEEDFVKQAEKNCINIAKQMTDALEYFTAMANFGNRFLDNYTPEHKEYFHGLEIMRDAVYRKYVDMISRCFMFVGVGGEDAKEYSLEQFKKHFDGDDRYCVMQFLDQYGRVPSSYDSMKDAKFREQAKKRLTKD